MNTDRITALITYSRLLYDRRLLHATGGNTSVRDGGAVLISATGAELGTLSEKQIVRVDLDGTVLAGEAPSKEMGMHLAMYRARDDVNAVIHAHPTYAITYSTMVAAPSADALPPYTAALYVRAGRVPLIDYHPSGSDSLHQAVAALAPAHRVILLRQHGLLAAAADMSEAMGIVEEVEQGCQIGVASALNGACLTEAQCREIDAALGRTWLD